MYFLYVFVVAALIASLLHIALSKKLHLPGRKLEIFLMYYLFICVGLQGVLGFAGNTFEPDAAELAKEIGWLAGNPFQNQLGVANLAFGVLGICCPWMRKGFWLSTILGSSIFFLGNAAIHLREMFVSHNFAPGNAGAPFVLNIIYPIIGIGLAIAFSTTSGQHFLSGKKKTKS